MRWVRRIAIGLVCVVGVALAVIYGGSTWLIHRSYAAPYPAITADRSPAGIAEGHRVAQTAGCLGCHGERGQGRVIADIPGVIHIAPPAIPEAIAKYSDRELARLIRHGVKRSGAGAYVMPIGGHSQIADDDLARMIGWLRTLKVSPSNSVDHLRIGILGRVSLLAGKVGPEISLKTEAPAKRPTGDVGPYLARSVCGGCHSLHEKREAHDDGRPVPALAVIGPAYDLPAFKTLLRTGVGQSPRNLGLMTSAARDGLSHLTDGEIEALHAYLVRESANTPPQ